uniref:Acylphosphatase n=1 Tax=Laticauda laticaudata TaxID=8630 RepID=A0A8C5WRT3_LATLA
MERKEGPVGAMPWRLAPCPEVREGSESQAPPTMAEGSGLISVDYEVFGKVQGVFFRKHTQAQGKKLGLVGWVQNTDYGTVQGQIQGPLIKVRQLQEWLQKTGSPKSHIDRAEFHNEKKIVHLEHSDFCIIK